MLLSSATTSCSSLSTSIFVSCAGACLMSEASWSCNHSLMMVHLIKEIQRNLGRTFQQKTHKLSSQMIPPRLTPKFLKLAVTSSCCCWRVALKSWNSWFWFHKQSFTQQNLFDRKNLKANLPAEVGPLQH